jgi:uncharacterized protein (TIGR02996 family)
MARSKPLVNDDLEAAIRSSPEDAPRLRYADWYEANGDRERAELIRVQIHLDRGAPLDPEHPDLERREHHLLSTHSKRWLARLPTPEGVSWEFLRGFPTRAVFDGFGVFDKRCSEVLASAPVEAIRFNTLRAVTRLAGSAALARVRRLELRGTLIRDAGADALAASPHLANLTHLFLDGNEITEAGVEALAASPHLGRVTHLRLGAGWGHRNPFGDAGAIALSRSASLRNVEELFLDHTRLGSEGLRSLLSASGWQKLTWLQAQGCPLGPSALAPLAEGRLPALRGLALRDSRVGDGGANCISRAEQLTGLRALDLRGCLLGDAGAIALAGRPTWRGCGCSTSWTTR